MRPADTKAACVTGIRSAKKRLDRLRVPADLELRELRVAQRDEVHQRARALTVQ